MIMSGIMLPAWYQLKKDQIGVEQENYYTLIVREPELCRDDCEVYMFGCLMHQFLLCAAVLCGKFMVPQLIASTLKKMKGLMIRKDVADIFDPETGPRHYIMLQLLSPGRAC